LREGLGFGNGLPLALEGVIATGGAPVTIGGILGARERAAGPNEKASDGLSLGGSTPRLPQMKTELSTQMDM